MSPRNIEGGTARVHLNRLLSKRGILTRSQANAAILAGRVTVDGRVIRDPGKPVDRGARIELDAQPTGARVWRTILCYKPQGVITTRRDPEGRRTVYDLLGDAAKGLVPVGRLDQATSGLLLLTSDTRLADRMTDPRYAVPRVYVVSVRGKATPDICQRLEEGVVLRGQRMSADSVTLRRSSGRESHLAVTLTEGKNREVRRLFETHGRTVKRLQRIQIGKIKLGELKLGKWRTLTEPEIKSLLG